MEVEAEQPGSIRYGSFENDRTIIFSESRFTVTEDNVNYVEIWCGLIQRD